MDGSISLITVTKWTSNGRVIPSDEPFDLILDFPTHYLYLSLFSFNHHWLTVVTIGLRSLISIPVTWFTSVVTSVIGVGCVRCLCHRIRQSELREQELNYCCNMKTIWVARKWVRIKLYVYLKYIILKSNIQRSNNISD